jgi:putative SOS response-associated peptidase YedK
MCNRFRMTAHQAEIARRYGVALPYPEDLTIPPPELFPKRPAWVVREEGGQRVLDVMTWGFPPPAAGRAPVTNVRNLASPFWKGALGRPDRRCLVPVTDFCEWSGEKGSKQEHWFSVRERPIFSFAGVWRPTAAGPAMAFLTCGYLGDPTEHVVGAIHDKAIPVILHEEDEAGWLSGAYDEVCSLAEPFPSQLMEVR